MEKKELILNLMEIELNNNLLNEKYDPKNSKELSNKILKNLLNKIISIGINEYKLLGHCLYLRNDFNLIDTYSLNLWDENSDWYLIKEFQNENIRFILTIWGIKN